jgi:acetyl-CoA decarbonylase/synthase complex subunit gamma
LSFDHLRKALTGRNAWILVLDTDGVNVWCAAGKGSFGTDELVRRIESVNLAQIVSSREIILPQLGGPGIASLQVKKRSGFKAVYGPIRSQDLPAFMDAGLKATPEMRQKTFSTRERMVLIPVELVSALKYALIITVAFFIMGGLFGADMFWHNALNAGAFAGITLFMGISAGAIMTPLLLPWLPGRAFALKGLVMGLIVGSAFLLFGSGAIQGNAALLETVSQFFLIPAVAAFIAMNFTGSSTYTSLSGVRKEMKWAVPPEIGAVIIGLGFWLGSQLVS